MVKMPRYIVLLCLVVVPVVIASTMLLLAELFVISDFDIESDRFYTCPSGFYMEIRYQAVRCIRYPQENYATANSCPTAFATRQTDYRDNQDMCLSALLKTVDLICPKDTQIYIQPGEDLCVKRLDGAIVAPDVITKR